ncbi:MAG: CotH kinase family protein [Clostridia bacterium]|nr:CotH kinase family protein [Clostridia bacterium]
MKKRLLSLLLASLLALTACGGSASPDETQESRTYTHDERMEILDDTALKLPVDFYETEAKARYFETLDIIRQEYFEPMSVADQCFTDFLEAKAALTCSYRSDYPVIVITAPNNLGKTYADGYVTVIEDGEIIESDVTIKVRGNSTAGAPKKPYNIKFPESVSLLGMEEGKKWSLLANMFDKTMLRNKLALDFAGEMGLAHTSQSEFCEVWFNGKYQGNYLLCEPVSDGKNRLDLDTSGNEFILEITPFGGWSFKSGAGVEILYDSPEDPTEAQKTYLNKLLDLAEAAMESGDLKECAKYIDVQSFIDLYCMMELFKDVDGYWKSLYFYVKDDKLCAGPAWDFDLSCGNVSKTYVEDNYFNYHNSNGYGDKSNDSTHGLRMAHGWWAILLESEEFASMVRERYLELQSLIVNLYEDNELGGNRIDALIEENGASFNREYTKDDGSGYGAGWSISEIYSIYAGESMGDYEDNVEFLREWLRDRNAWLLENIGK